MSISPEEYLRLSVDVARLLEGIVRLDQRIGVERELTESRFVTFRTLIDQESRRVELALAASDKAITKSEESYDKRFELLNELRSGVATREQLEALEKRLNELATRMDRSEGHGAGAKDNRLGLYAAIGAVGVVLGILVVIMNTMGGT